MSIKAKILVVDDDPMITYMLKEHFVSEGHAVEMGSDGSAAIESAKSHKPALIIMDIGMPGSTGLEALTNLRKYEETRLIPIIFVTGMDSKHLDSVIDEHQRVAYVKKPINLESLSMLVQLFLSKYGPSSPGPMFIETSSFR